MATNTRRVPLDKRKRTEISCDKCKSRKQKCDRLVNQTACRYCELHGLECSTTQPRKQRVCASIEGLGSRHALLESLVKGLLPEANLSSNGEMQQLGRSLGIPLPSIDGTDGVLSLANTRVDDESTLPLLPDQQGQAQYIGPASSFSFHLKLRRLIGDYTSLEFAMFGRNAAELCETNDMQTSPDEGGGTHQHNQSAESTPPGDSSLPLDSVRGIDGPFLNMLLDAYFDTVHADFPVLGLEASFRERFEIWLACPSESDPTWLCTLLCVLLLAYRVASVIIPKGIEEKWWRQVQKLLPAVFFASNDCAIQALMLAALHLHNTEHRDACWNLTGTAIRVAFAIGLHRDDIRHAQSLLARELRKQLWWTLYAFEQIQVSSYDRPSAIADVVCSVDCPNERIVGIAGHCPQDLIKSSHRLVILLGSACKSLSSSTIGSTTAEDAYARPLSPAAGIIRDLNRWKEALPLHLHLSSSSSLSPSSQRSVLLLHAQENYIAVLILRSALLRRATIVSKTDCEPVPPALIAPCRKCVESGEALGRLMLRLDSINRFNALTWWDIFYTITSAMILVLDVHYRTKQREMGSAAESQTTLRELAGLAAKHLQNPRMPGSMQKWANLVVEISSIAEQLRQKTRSQEHATATAKRRSGAIPALSTEEHEASSVHHSPYSHRPASQGSGFILPGGVPDLSASAQTILPVEFDDMQESGSQLWSQFTFLNDSSWPWDDIEAMLRGDSSPQLGASDLRRRAPY